MTMLTRTLHPEVRIVDADKGIVDYIASDETIDSYREVVRADGWRFNRFEKNAPFVDSHDYYTIEKQLGRVVSWEIKGRQLIERVQWAIDVPENTLAQFGWKMLVAGYLKAVSVGFMPTRYVTNFDKSGEFEEQLADLKKTKDDGIRTIFLEQEQIELSACIIGANPSAVAKAFKEGAVSEEDLDTLSRKLELDKPTGLSAGMPDSAATSTPSGKSRERFLMELRLLTNQ